MEEVFGDIWNYYDKGNWIVITTNGTIKKNGEAVMGRGIAFQAKQRLSKLPSLLGMAIKEVGNQVGIFSFYRLVTFPVKNHWWEKASLDLIEKSCYELVDRMHYLKEYFSISEIYMVRPGCGNGQLDWKTEVKPVLEKYFDDRFIIVEQRVS